MVSHSSLACRLVGVPLVAFVSSSCFSCLRFRSFFFFFQAEDGIRDTSVTGVQTCALPISWFVTHRAPPIRPSVELTQKRLTFNTSDNPVESQDISPDGKYLAYSHAAEIHVKLLSTGEERIIPKPAGISSSGRWSVASWFPDGAQLLAKARGPGGQGRIWTASGL